MERPWQNILYILLTANTLVSGRGEAQKDRFLTDGRSPSPSVYIKKKKKVVVAKLRKIFQQH